jgi:hypothetical protein
MDKKKYQLEKLRNRKTGYPIATIAYYGSDDQFASKVVVGIQLSENDEESLTLQKWFFKEKDVRQDESILHEIIEYIDANHVHRVAMVNRIIGCPHEEGIDYPAGEICPKCTFWANRDLWTGEIVSSRPG